MQRKWFPHGREAAWFIAFYRQRKDHRAGAESWLAAFYPDYPQRNANRTGRNLADRIAPLLTEMRSVLTAVSSTQQAVRGVLKLNVTGAVMTDILPP